MELDYHDQAHLLQMLMDQADIRDAIYGYAMHLDSFDEVGRRDLFPDDVQATRSDGTSLSGSDEVVRGIDARGVQLALRHHMLGRTPVPRPALPIIADGPVTLRSYSPRFSWAWGDVGSGGMGGRSFLYVAKWPGAVLNLGFQPQVR